MPQEEQRPKQPLGGTTFSQPSPEVLAGIQPPAYGSAMMTSEAITTVSASGESRTYSLPPLKGALNTEYP